MKSIEAIVITGSHPTEISESLTKIELDNSIKKLEDTTIKYDTLKSKHEKQTVSLNIKLPNPIE